MLYCVIWHYAIWCLTGAIAGSKPWAEGWKFSKELNLQFPSSRITTHAGNSFTVVLVGPGPVAPPLAAPLYHFLLAALEDCTVAPSSHF